MTNFERITLSEKTLARELARHIPSCVHCFAANKCIEKPVALCVREILDWLEQESEQ